MPTYSSKLTTIERHILAEQEQHPSASGDLTNLLYDIALAAKIISREVNRAGLADILGVAGNTNTSGDEVKRLDEYADKAIFRVMDHTGRLCAMASEEQEDLISIPERFATGKYVFLYDPLDGSSNIDANVSIGTIFSIHRKITYGARGTLEDALQPGHRQVAAGYVLYGPSTVMVYTTGHGVHGFTLDPTIGEFLLSHPNMKAPKQGAIYSTNEQGYWSWDPKVRAYVDWIKKDDKATRRPRSSRYIGSLVSDFHRNLLYGGIFFYPATAKNPDGKLRLLYELAPLAMIAEQAGGRAVDGRGNRILDLHPTGLHQRAPVFLGSEDDVREAEVFLRGEHPAQKT